MVGKGFALTSSVRRTRNGAAGFTLPELLIVVGVIAVMGAAAVPLIAGAMQQYTLNSSVQAVSAAIRGARYAAVSKGRTLRVRFNCPAAGQFRVIEVVGNALVDNDANRCSAAAYPYPDPDPAAGPSIDGPVVMLTQGAQFVATQDIEINTAGRITPLVGVAPATVRVTNGNVTQNIVISQNGQIAVP